MWTLNLLIIVTSLISKFAWAFEVCVLLDDMTATLYERCLKAINFIQWISDSSGSCFPKLCP